MGNLCYVKLIILIVILLTVLDLRFNFSGKEYIQAPARGPDGRPVGILAEHYEGPFIGAGSGGNDYSWGGKMRQVGTDVSLHRGVGDIDASQLARFYR